MLLALLLLVAPQPGELRNFHDWTAGCDNGRACQVVALLPEDGPEGATLAVRRGPEADAVPVIWATLRVEGSPSPAALVIDGRAFPLRLDAANEELRVADAGEAARRLGQATRVELLVEEGGRRVVPVSAKGSAAALLYMDERQGRLGTTGALVRRGPATRVPSPPPLPVIATPSASPARPRALPAAQLRRLLGKETTTCEYAQPFDPENVRLDARTSLVLAGHPCGNGAYNNFSTAFLIDERGRARRAAFDAPGGMGDVGGALVNAGWDASQRRLTTYAKGRGLGDCGVAQAFAWDGTRFRLAEQSEMSECRGSTDYVTTWRARVVAR